MNYGNYQQPSNQAPKNRSYAILGCLGALGVLILILAVLAGGYMMFAAPPYTPMVLINSPRNNENIAVGEAVMIQATAHGDQKIERIELWVDGVLLDAQSSNVPGGISPFPIIANWQPSTAGSHTIIARAYNTRGTHSQASINVNTPQTADRDNDSVPDETDACPDQAGTSVAGGCPDRDSDGISDASDTCPDQAGMPDSGCPAPAEGDRDGDGMLDTTDACPDIAGSPRADGCLDGDGDGIADASDTCPAEAGGGDGCPAPGGAGADDIPDGGEAADGEGPPTDPEIPIEEPLNPEDDDISGEREPIPDAGGWEAINVVRLEALEFSVSNTEDYDQVFCYAGQVDRDMEHYGPFSPLGNQHWDIVEYMGGENSRTFGVIVGDPLELYIECLATSGPTVRYLGYISRTYDSSQWDGHVIQELSGMVAEERGDPGHTFDVKFRLCLRSCEDAEFPPPALHLFHERIGFINFRFLGWVWDGELENITGFRLYINGNRRATIRNADANRLNMREYLPACGETYEYQLTAYSLDGAVLRESPPSNTIRVRGEPCPRRVKVTFEQLHIADLDYIGGDMAGRGPIYGTFMATGANTKTLRFDGGECWSFLWIFSCEGYDVGDGTYNIANIFRELRLMEDSCIGDGCLPVYAPENNYVIVELNDSDDLTITGRIGDEEAYGSDETLWNGIHTVPAGDAIPPELLVEDENEFGTFTVRIRLEELSEP